MSVASVDLTQNDSVKSVDSDDNIDFSKLLDKPRHLNIERQRSLDEKSLVEASPRHPLIAENGRHMDFENVFSPSKRSSFNSCNAQYGLEPHLMFVEAWEALRKTMVYFRGQPVGTIAALDNSDEKLNYDQVRRVILTTRTANEPNEHKQDLVRVRLLRNICVREPFTNTYPTRFYVRVRLLRK
ncbi:putative beta-fructofuranosidase [Helianthus annuus]|nr:putative beta-fructofuranosidase [Helianthus annuus]KAJ0636444.1 putative beta-fructofuranosidase [Helianthus annuus]